MKERARAAKKRVIFPEQSDARVREALDEIRASGICRPVILEPDPGINGCEVFREHPQAQPMFDEVVESYTRRRAHRGMTPDAAKQELSDPLLLATNLVKTGYVDTGVAGSLATTADVVRACLLGIGLAEDSRLVSSTFLMDHHYRLMTFGDCGVNPNPDAEQLAHIAIDSARTHGRLTGEEPKVALLSFSTHGSAEDESVDKVRRALEIARAIAPKLSICGELQADAALVPEIGAAKASASEVAGSANVLIFPDLNSGNIAYKLAERLGGAHAMGPILQGLDKPWIDLSRGCDAHDIIHTASIASVLAT